MRKKRDVDHNASIQYRPGVSFGKQLTNLSKEWGIPRPEVGRRLALMGAYELPLDLYSPLAEAADALGGVHGFEQACNCVNGAFHGESILRPDPTIFTDPEKKRQYVVQVLSILTPRRHWPDLDEEQEEKKQFVAETHSFDAKKYIHGRKRRSIETMIVDAARKT